MKTQLIAPLMLAAVLAACGDSPTAEVPVTPPVASNEVPASATASSTAYSQYAGSLAANDSSEPLDVSKVVAPASETEEPIPVT